MRTPSAWRPRFWLFALLGAALLANVAVLVSYRLLYDDRLEALRSQERALVARRDEAAAALKKAESARARLAGLQAQLETFYGSTLGTRRERLAPLLTEIYRMTRKLGLRPPQIGYAEAEIPGGEQILLSFEVVGTYADVKKLLYEFETTPRFLVVERVGVSLDEAQPDRLAVTLEVAHFFRSAETRIPKGPGRAAPARRGAGRPR